MHHVTAMLETHPQATANEALARCIEQCFVCALTCTSCADACLAEEHVQEPVRCIRLNLDCADVCDAAGRVLTRQTSSEPRPLAAPGQIDAGEAERPADGREPRWRLTE